VSDREATATLSQRPRRADAQRNYDKLVGAAREAFTEGADENVSLEDVARRAGVGIGTLYRHFPTRQNLIEAVYEGEVHALSHSAEGLLADQPPWEALSMWLHGFVAYVHTKQALMQELFAVAGQHPEVFARCRTELYGAGEPLLERAQAAGIVRDDVTIADVLHLVSGIAKATPPEPIDVTRLLDIALDGLRAR
jgi:AcrR family transcriptional regulator